MGDQNIRKPNLDKKAAEFELKPSSYQPTKKELEADLSLPASFDEVMDALFANDTDLPNQNVPDRTV